MHKIYMQVTMSYKVKERQVFSRKSECTIVLKDESIQFEVKTDRLGSFECTLKDVVEHIDRRPK